MLNRNIQRNASWEGSTSISFLSLFMVSFKKYSTVYDGNGAGLDGNWPFMQIKSTPSMLGLRMGHRTEVQLEAPWGLTRGSFFHGERGRESSRVWLWTKASRIQWCHHNENILSREGTPIYTMTTDVTCVPLSWEGALPNTLGWTSRMWPVLLGEQGPPRCWLSEQRPGRMKDVTWMCCKVRLGELKHWAQP